METTSDRTTPDRDRTQPNSERAADSLVPRIFDATRVALLWGVTFAVAASGPLLMGHMGHF